MTDRDLIEATRLVKIRARFHHTLKNIAVSLDIPLQDVIDYILKTSLEDPDALKEKLRKIFAR